MEVPVSPQLAGTDREVGGRHGSRQHGLRFPLSRYEQVDPGLGVVPRCEERQSVGVVPVQVTEQDRSSKWTARQLRRETHQAGTGVEDQPGDFAFPPDRHT